MKNEIKENYDSKWIIFYTMLFFLCVGCGRFYYDWIFAIKPAIILTGAGTIISLLILRKMAPLYSFEKWLILCLFIYMLACVRPNHLNIGIRYFCGIIMVLLFYFCARIALEKITISQLETVISYSGIILCGFSLISYIWGLYLVNFQFSDIPRSRYGGILFENHIPRLFGSFDKDPNIAALLLMIYVIYYLYHLNSIKNIIGIVMSNLCFILTFSRSGILALIFALLIGRILPYYRRKPIRFQRYYLLIPLAIVIFLVVLKVSGIDWLEMLKRRLSLLSVDKGSGRFTLWKYGINGWLENPIFGIGGNYTKTYIYQLWGYEKVLHNSWLEVLLETGIAGFIPCVLFLVNLFKNALKCGLASNRRWLFVLLLSSFIMMCSISVWFNFNFYLVIAILFRFSSDNELKEKKYAGTGYLY